VSVSTTIKNALKTKVQSCSSVQAVYAYEKPNPTGFPCVFIKTLDVTGEFVSNVENSRVYSYSLLTIFPIGQDIELPVSTEKENYAEGVIATVIDEIIDAVDTDFELTGTSQVLYVNASDCEWGEYEYEGGVAKAGLITLKIYTEKNIL
jgi:hypothetical protein